MQPDMKYILKPQAISRDKRLTPIEQDYLCLIAYFQLLDGCTASNQVFANYFGVNRSTAVEVISKLRAKGFIETTEEKSGGKTIKRTITIIDADSRNCLLSDSRKLLLSDSRKLPAGIVGDCHFDSRKLRNHRREREDNKEEIGENSAHEFTKPTVQEVTDYAKSIGYDLDGQHFIDTYEARGWMIGKSKMKNWQAAVRNWKRNDDKDGKINYGQGKSKNRTEAVAGKRASFAGQTSQYGITIDD